MAVSHCFWRSRNLHFDGTTKTRSRVSHALSPSFRFRVAYSTDYAGPLGPPSSAAGYFHLRIMHCWECPPSKHSSKAWRGR